MHVNTKRQLFITLNINKNFDIDVILYYVKEVYLKKFKFDQFLFRYVIESIFFSIDLLWKQNFNIDSLN